MKTRHEDDDTVQVEIPEDVVEASKERAALVVSAYDIDDDAREAVAHDMALEISRAWATSRLVRDIMASNAANANRAGRRAAKARRRKG